MFVAIWLSTGATVFSIVVCFVVAQIIFCISLRTTPHLKGHFSVASRFMSKNSFDGTQGSQGRRSASEDLNESNSSRSRQVVTLPRIDHTGKSRFFPPSRLRASKEAYRPSTLSPVREEDRFFGGVGSNGVPGVSPVLSSLSNQTSIRHASSPFTVCCHKCRTSCCECHQSGTDTEFIVHGSSTYEHEVVGDPVATCSHQDLATRDRQTSVQMTSNPWLQLYETCNDVYVVEENCDSTKQIDNFRKFSAVDQRSVPVPVTSQDTQTQSAMYTTDDAFDLPYYGDYFTDESSHHVERSGSKIGRRNSVNAENPHFQRSPGLVLNALNDNRKGPYGYEGYDADDDDVFEQESKKSQMELVVNMYGDEDYQSARGNSQYNTYSGKSTSAKRKSLKHRLSGKFKAKSSLKRLSTVNQNKETSLPEDGDDKQGRKLSKKRPEFGNGDSRILKRTISPPLVDLMPEENIPYFLRNHPETWKYILPNDPPEEHDGYSFPNLLNEVKQYESPTSLPETTVYSPATPHIINKYSTFKPLKNKQTVAQAEGIRDSNVYSVPIDMMSRHSSTHELLNSSLIPIPTNNSGRSTPRYSYVSCLDSSLENHEDSSRFRRTDYSSDSGVRYKPYTSSNGVRPKTIARDKVARSGSRRASLVKDYVNYLESSSFEPIKFADPSNTSYIARSQTRLGIHPVPTIKEDSEEHQRLGTDCTSTEIDQTNGGIALSNYFSDLHQTEDVDTENQVSLEHKNCKRKMSTPLIRRPTFPPPPPPLEGSD